MQVRRTDYHTSASAPVECVRISNVGIKEKTVELEREEAETSALGTRISDQISISNSSS
jgi:hypothetical protein